MTSLHEYHQFEIGPMKNFCYFIGSSRSQNVFVVDPGWDSEKILSLADEKNKIITGILCTHSHKDHIDAVESLEKILNIPVYMSSAEIEFSGFSSKNLKTFNDNAEIPIDDLKVIARLTPGHTIGSTCFEFGPFLITGDTLFINGCGRCDLKSSNPVQMYNTLRNIVEKQDMKSIILPGHNYGPTPTDTLKGQLTTNMYLKHKSLDSFLEHRMMPRM